MRPLAVSPLMLATLPAVNLSPDRSSDAEPALSFRYRASDFAMSHRHFMVFESGSPEHCMTLVTRYPSAS